MDTNIVKDIKQSAEQVFEILGTGHSEIVYHRALEVELRMKGIIYSTKAPITLLYKGIVVGYSEPDLIVYPNGIKGFKIIIELKATTYAPRSSEKAQIESYLRSTSTKYGILINFPQPTSKTQASEIDFISYGIESDDDHDLCTDKNIPMMNLTLL